MLHLSHNVFTVGECDYAGTFAATDLQISVFNLYHIPLMSTSQSRFASKTLFSALAVESGDEESEDEQLIDCRGDSHKVRVIHAFWITS